METKRIDGNAVCLETDGKLDARAAYRFRGCCFVCARLEARWRATGDEREGREENQEALACLSCQEPITRKLEGTPSRRRPRIPIMV